VFHRALGCAPRRYFGGERERLAHALFAPSDARRSQ
jgi:hypothetical protein